MSKAHVSTGRGDDGYTDLANGVRVSKGHPVIGAMAQLDMLCTQLGVLRTVISKDAAYDTEAIIRSLQKDVLAISGRLAGYSSDQEVWGTMVDRIITLYNALSDTIEIGPVFVLPGDNAQSVQADLARAQCRRAEHAVAVIRDRAEIEDSQEHTAAIVDTVLPDALALLNRLADYLFVLARSLVL